MPEWSKGADLRSAGFGLVGSNPTPYRYFNNLLKVFLYKYIKTMTSLSPYITDFYKTDVLIILVIVYYLYYYI